MANELGNVNARGTEGVQQAKELGVGNADTMKLATEFYDHLGGDSGLSLIVDGLKAAHEAGNAAEVESLKRMLDVNDPEQAKILAMY